VLALAALAAPAVAEERLDRDGVRVLAPAPEPGAHPRIWLTAEELPELRRRLEETTFGPTAVQPILDRFPRNFMNGTKELRAWDGKNPTKAMVEKHFRAHEGRQQEAGVAAIKAALYGDEELTRGCIDWAVNYSRLVLASKRLTPEHRFWREKDEMGRDWDLGDEFHVKGLAYVYDFVYGKMAEAEREVVRRAIAEAVRGRRSHGLGWPATKQFSNHSPLHANLGCIALAIEGEEGYEPEIYELWVKLMRDWITVALSKGGVNHEDGYVYYALRGGLPFLIAAQKRGEKLLNIPNYRNMFRWQAHWEPVTGDLGGYQTYHIANKFMFPGDPIVNMFWRRRAGKDYQNRMQWQSAVDTVLFCMDYDGDGDAVADLRNLDLENMIHDPRRGVMIARNGWREDDLQFRFSARPDTMFVGHAAADSGSFHLNAIGRNWVFNNVGDKDSSFSSGDFSLVHIDGKALEMKPPTVKTLFARDTDAAAVIAADLTYAYNWVWHYYWVVPKRTGREDGTGGLPGPPWVPEREDPYKLGWPAAEDFLPHDLSDQPDLGFVGIWLYKKRINTVAYAFRTAVLVRGERPYVLIVDDVRQDERERLYEWYLQVAPDLELLYALHDDIVLKEAGEKNPGGSIRAEPGARRMLVRCLGPWKDFPKTQPMAYSRPNFHGGARIETHQYGFNVRKDRAQVSARLGKRLVVPWRGTSGRFVMLLYPYKTTMPLKAKEAWAAWCDNPAGAPLPSTKWNDDHTVLTVKSGEQTDSFKFEVRPDGRRTVRMTRNGKPVLTGD
jgi:hypothetical protein